VSELYDPVLALSQRRRDRHTLLSVERSTDADLTPQIQALLEALSALREAQARDLSSIADRVANVEARTSRMETVFEQIAKIPRKEVA